MATAAGAMFGGTGLSFGRMSAGELLRLPAASVVSGLYLSTGTINGVLGVVGAIAGVHAGAWLLALLIMPFVDSDAAGGRLYLGSVKLMLCATVCLVPLGLALVRQAWIGTKYEDRFPWFKDVTWTEAVIPWIALWLVWSLSTVLRMAASMRLSAGERRSQDPLCVECGYNLTGQPMSGRCPECGTPVERSTPAYRRLPRWATAAGWGRRLLAYSRTAWEMMLRRDWFTRLAVYEGRATATRFMVWNLILGAVLITSGFLVFAVEDFGRLGGAKELSGLVAGLSAVATGSAVLGFLAISLVILRSAHAGRCGFQATAVTMCYASALFLPACLCLSASLWTGSLAMDSGWLGWIPSREDWTRIIRYYGFHVLNSAPPIAAFTWAMFRLRRALKDVRFAAA